jgi:cupin 2 domain-containing protein
METGNLFGEVPAQLPEELFQILVVGEGTRIERIVSKGHVSPPGYWYEQPENEWVMVVKGEAKLRFEKDDRMVHLVAGDYVNIETHERHRVEWTREDVETVWLAVFYQE